MKKRMNNREKVEEIFSEIYGSIPATHLNAIIEAMKRTERVLDQKDSEVRAATIKECADIINKNSLFHTSKCRLLQREINKLLSPGNSEVKNGN